MKFEETKVVSVDIPVTFDKFYDDKEITDLFTYVFEQSQLCNIRHPFMDFKVGYEYGMRVSRFTMTLRADAPNYDSIKNEMEMLANEYHIFEVKYLRFKKFGNIESGAMIRRKH
jgi:hypothetical protein